MHCPNLDRHTFWANHKLNETQFKLCRMNGRECIQFNSSPLPATAIKRGERERKNESKIGLPITQVKLTSLPVSITSVDVCREAEAGFVIVA